MGLPTLTYHDAYLKALIDDAAETRAYADVDALGAFDTTWRDKLTVLRAYVITCMEKQADPEDLFTAKLAVYRKEFDSVLAMARAASAVASGTGPALISIPIMRG